MKTTLVASVALTALALSACTTQNTTTLPKEPTKVHRTQDGKTPPPPPHHRGEHSPVVYQCDSSTTVVAHYKPQADKAVIHITAPSLRLDNQAVELKEAVSGSGVRFINDTNPASTYEWHTKGSMGVLTVNVNGKDYSYSCEATHPDMPHDAVHQ